MLLIHCPWCGERAESEFNYGGEAGIVRPIDAASKDKGTWLSDEQWGDYVFMRKNTRGVFKEQWVHTHGCRRWFEAERDTQTYEFLSVTPMKSHRIVQADDGPDTTTMPAPVTTGTPAPGASGHDAPDTASTQTAAETVPASEASTSRPAAAGQTGDTPPSPVPAEQASATTPSSSRQAASPAGKAGQAPQGDA